MNASDRARDPAFDVPEVLRIQPRVDAAADKLLSRGVPPTVALVRAEMGGGSPNTVAPALRHWRARRERALPRGTDHEAIPSPVLNAARMLYDAALETAAHAAGTGQAEMAAQLESARAANALLAAEMKHALREVETLRSERTSLFEAAGHTRAELVTAQTLAARYVADQRSLQERLDLCHRRLGEARARITVLESRLSTTSTDIKRASAARKGARAAHTAKAVVRPPRMSPPRKARRSPAGVRKKPRR